MIYLALVTFEHGDDEGDHLPLQYQGACGWMAVDAEDEEEAVDVLAGALAAERLVLVEAELLQAVSGAQDAERVDDHLADNMRDWEPGRRTVWGTIRCYVGNRAV
jgi:hypothetical protein